MTGTETFQEVCGRAVKVRIKQDCGDHSGATRREIVVGGEIVGQVTQRVTRWGAGAWRLTLTDSDKQATVLEIGNGYNDFSYLAEVRAAVAAAFATEAK